MCTPELLNQAQRVISRREKIAASEFNRAFLDAIIPYQGVEYLIERYYELKNPYEARRIGQILDLLQPKTGEQILEVGCGTGQIVFHIARLAGRAFGVDYSYAAVSTAKTITNNVYQMDCDCFLCGDAIALPFGDGSFDKVVCVDVIEHIPVENHSLLFSEILRVMRGGDCYSGYAKLIAIGDRRSLEEDC